ncbi:MAG: peptidoglycan DD-metalloendopeptidase family protein [Candidatus Andersenbacteria bacterium]
MSNIPKKSAVHMAFFGLISAIVVQSQIVGTGDTSSFLHTFIAGDVVSEGPLSPTAYAQGTSSSSSGSRLATVDATDANFITFDDPEVRFAQTLEGNAVVAPMQPTLDTVDSSTGENVSHSSTSSSQKPFIYTVEDGDTIASIASHYNISTNTILSANGLRSADVIKSGDHLTILPVTGVLHTVKSGDTVLSIANTYKAKAVDIVSSNNLEDSSKIALGQKLIIPNGDAPVQQAPRIVSQSTQTARDAGDEPTPAPQKEQTHSSGGFVWPTTSHHMSQYFKNGHTGIDIDNRSMPSVFAAQEGTVEFAGWLGGYGNLIIINHGSGLTTYYAHLSKFYIAKGAKVKKGDAIAKMGSTGHSTGPHVHFEVRRFGQPINPLGMY